MAANRENQGLQIALILFVMVTVALAVTTYVCYKGWVETAQKAYGPDRMDDSVGGLEGELADAKAAMRKVMDDNIKLKSMMGHVAEEKVEDIETTYSNDMLQFGADFPEENRNYRTLPEYLVAAIRDRNAQVADATLREKQLIAEKEKVREEEHALVVKALEGQKAHAADLAQERSKFNTERTRVVTQLGGVAKNLDDVRKEVASVKEDKDKEIEALASQLNKSDQLRKALVEKVQGAESEKFDSFDGKITWVNQKTGMVWINIGSSDALRPQTSFSVYDKGETNLQAAQPKGSIEVTRILDSRLAEARIVDDQLANPLLPGDQIASPVWQPGRKLRFAIAGFIDIDGDDKSDRVQLKNLITSHGGVIDAEVDEDGRRTGKMTINTRYLVLGERPTEKTSDAGIRSFSQIQDEASTMGIEKLSVDKLLEMMGWEGNVKTTRLGRFANSEDFPAEADSGVNRRSTGNTAFQPRPRPGAGR